MRCHLPGHLLAHEPTAGVEQPDPDELGDGVDEPGATQAAWLHVADDLQREAVLELAVDAHHLDGTVGGTPTFLINGKVAEGAISWSQVQDALKKAGA